MSVGGFLERSSKLSLPMTVKVRGVIPAPVRVSGTQDEQPAKKQGFKLPSESNVIYMF